MITEIGNEGGAALAAENIRKSFGGRSALAGLDMSVGYGRVHSFVGPNGAGKSTALKIFAGAMFADSGAATVCGCPLGSVEARGRLGYSPETPRFYADMTAADFLLASAGMRGMSAASARDRLRRLDESFGIGRDIYKKMGSYSAGMLKKVSLINAMIHSPKLLLLDEPTANLDPGSRLELIGMIKETAAAEGTAVLISSHVLGEIEEAARDISLIDKGVIKYEGPLADVLRAMSKGRFLMRTSNNAMAAGLLRETGLISSATQREDGFMTVTTDDGDKLKKEIFAAMSGNFIKLEYFSSESMSLADVFGDAYKEIMKEEEDETAV